MEGVFATITATWRRARSDGPLRYRVEAEGLRLSFRRSPDWLKMKNLDAPAVKREGLKSTDNWKEPHELWYSSRPEYWNELAQQPGEIAAKAPLSIGDYHE